MISRQEATSALAGFHAGPLSWSNWNLEMLVFVEAGKPENPEKNPWSKGRANNKLNLHLVSGQNQTKATLVGGEHSHVCAIPAPCLHNGICFTEYECLKHFIMKLLTNYSETCVKLTPH